MDYTAQLHIFYDHRSVIENIRAVMSDFYATLMVQDSGQAKERAVPYKTDRPAWQPPGHTRGTVAPSPAINFPRRFNVHRRVQSQTSKPAHPLRL